ncbi:LPS export ABC transporter permease LptF [Azovibrio restrictus]|uniref:LPS export ABC transporter permease LptF n=1 Tax=Azovibrio restrictus TaxID=146938 RepID=UPI0026EFCF68|nr:LPS export ABC transporter permease LptF [Azovibrio restrictus]
MIFERAARREFAQVAVGVFVALFAILVSTQLIRLLNDAAGGRLAPEAVVALLGFAALNYLPTLLSISLFMAILLPLSRAYKDSEMVVWFSSGLSLVAWVRPVLRFALPLVVTIALLSLFLSPWAQGKSVEYRQKLDARSDASQVSPGAFQEVSSGERVVFVEKASGDAGFVRNVFVTTVMEGRLGVVMAETGRQETLANGDRFLMLRNGYRYEVEPGSPELRMMEFEQYGVRIHDAEVRAADRSPRHMSTWELLQGDSARERGELLWRLGVPASALLLAVLAIPLAFVNPRAGRSFNMLLAIVIFTLYSNLLSISQAWVARELVPFALAMPAPHLFMGLVLAILFHRRLVVFAFWQRRAG